MSQHPSKALKTGFTVNRIVLIYFFVGSAWIIFSDLWLLNFLEKSPDSGYLIALETIKGLAYILATTILLWILCRSWARQVERALSKYEQSRSQYEHKLLMLNAMLRAIRRVNKAIVGTPEVDPLIRKICEILVEDREFKHAWIALLDENGKPRHYHNAPNLKDAEKLKHFLEEGKLTRCFESTKAEDGLILAARPLEQCPGFPIMDGLEDCALLGIEFRYDHSVGYIALMTSQIAIKDQDEIDLFREVAEDLRFALQSIRAEAERVRATEDLLTAKQAAEKANRAKDEFLSVMSHELRTPLNPIMGHAGLLMEETDDPHCIQSLQQIYQSSEKLLSLIDDILFFSQLQKGTKNPRSIHFRLLESCQFALQKARKCYPKQRLDFENGTGVHLPIDEEMIVAGDAENMQRILGELLDNACKYTHEGRVCLRVGQRELDSETLEFIVEVEDSGIGIEEEVLEKLFDPFTQLDSSHTRRYEGIGLGLAICKKIADALDGTLTAESQPGVGSCFRFCCPMDRIELSAAEGTASRPARSTIGSNRKRVLLVEDNLSNAEVAKTMVERLGLEVELATEGHSAVEICRSQLFQVILMDLSMPVMNGFEATRQIREPGALNEDTPIIGLTAHVGTAVKDDCLNAGMVDFIPKPIRMNALRDSLSKFI
jgi:signal transduction histidine kinase